MTVDGRSEVAVRSVPTTLSSLARGAQIRTPPRWSRTRVAMNVAAIAAGGVLGTALALRGTTDGSSDAARVPGPPQAAAGGASAGPAMPVPTGAPPSAVPVAGSPDRRTLLVVQIQQALLRFLAWSHAHPGARCPDAAALGVAELDPWGQPLRIVCADQPVDQIAGVVSFGPDGVPGTDDDVLSWTLGKDITDLVRGPRWATRPARASTTRSVATPWPSADRAADRSADHSLDHSPDHPPDRAADRAADRSADHSPGNVPANAPGRPSGSAGGGSNDTDGEGIPNRR